MQLQEYEIKYLCTKAREIFINQPILLELEAPIKICGASASSLVALAPSLMRRVRAGDIHGQYYDLLRLFEYGGFPPEANYLFLGDYVDRGKQSLETICLLLAYKIKYPENFFVLRGNHECASINRIYGFYDECASSACDSLCPAPLTCQHRSATSSVRVARQAPLQHQTMEDVYGLLQLPTYCRYHR